MPYNAEANASWPPPGYAPESYTFNFRFSSSSTSVIFVLATATISWSVCASHHDFITAAKFQVYLIHSGYTNITTDNMLISSHTGLFKAKLCSAIKL